jgi:tetratricopeptide (TPR) repeat protein
MTNNETGEAAGLVRQSLNEAMHFHAMGDLARAEKQYMRVLSKEYRTTDILPLLAGVVAKRGDTEMALYYWNKLLAINPGHLTALIEKGGILHGMRRTAEAVGCYEIARSLQPENALIRNNLAVALADSGRNDEALVEFNHVLRLQPDNLNAYHQIRRISSTVVPFWHVAMMNDVRRNDAFEAAICRAIKIRGTDAQILDIGAGSGLLSMMAARAGAESITTCESVPVIARTAEAIIADNGYSDRIKLVAKPSTALSVGKDLETKADILISEILSSDLLAENVLSTFEDARRRLIADDAIIIPQAAAAFGCLVASDTLSAYSNVRHVSGFDVSRFNTLAPIRLPVHGTMSGWTRLSGDFEIASLDLTLHSHEAKRRSISIPVTATGTVIGVVQWMHVDLIGDISFTNHPDDYHDGGWLQVLHAFPEPIAVEAGSELTLIVGHDKTSLIVMPAGYSAAGGPKHVISAAASSA